MKLSTIGNEKIYYTLDGSEPTEKSNLYKEPVIVSETSKLRAAALHDGKLSEVSALDLFSNKASFKDIQIDCKMNRVNIYGGPKMLVDGVKGSLRPDDARWIGFTHGFNATIDLGASTLVSRVILTNLTIMRDCVANPCKMSVALSVDGKNFKVVSSKEIETQTIKEETICEHALSFNAEQARYVKVVADAAIEPEGYPIAGEPFWLFISEIGVY